MGDLQQLVKAAGEGDAGAVRRARAAFYDELRGAARRLMANERVGHTLQPTALVNEAILRVVSGNRPIDFDDAQEFFAAAVNCMREILVEYARKKAAAKRGGDRQRVPLGDFSDDGSLDPTVILSVEEALERLEELEPRKAAVVKLRYFAGLTIDECAAVLEVASRTVDSDWRFARAWLHQELSKGDTRFSFGGYE